MDPETLSAEVQASITWLKNANVWNFGRFNERIDSQLYPLLNLPFPFPAEWDETRKSEIRAHTKRLKRKIFEQALQQLAREDNAELARKAVTTLAVSVAILSMVRTRGEILEHAEDIDHEAYPHHGPTASSRGAILNLPRT